MHGTDPKIIGIDLGKGKDKTVSTLYIIDEVSDIKDIDISKIKPMGKMLIGTPVKKGNNEFT